MLSIANVKKKKKKCNIKPNRHQRYSLIRLIQDKGVPRFTMSASRVPIAAEEMALFLELR